MIFIIFIIAAIMLACRDKSTKEEVQKEERAPHVKKLRDIEIQLYELELIRQLKDLQLSPEEAGAFLEYLDQLEGK
jgi:hypothetical protein